MLKVSESRKRRLFPSSDGPGHSQENRPFIPATGPPGNAPVLSPACTADEVDPGQPWLRPGRPPGSPGKRHPARVGPAPDGILSCTGWYCVLRTPEEPKPGFPGD